MNITDVRIQLVAPEKKPILAFASMTIDGAFAVHGLKILENTQGSVYVCMPSRKMQDGKFKDICHPIDSASRDVIVNAVLEAYNKEKNK